MLLKNCIIWTLQAGILKGFQLLCNLSSNNSRTFYISDRGKPSKKYFWHRQWKTAFQQNYKNKDKDSNMLFLFLILKGLAVSFYPKEHFSRGAMLLSPSFSLVESTTPRAKPLHQQKQNGLPFVKFSTQTMSADFLQMVLSLRIGLSKGKKGSTFRMLWNINLPKQTDTSGRLSLPQWSSHRIQFWKAGILPHWVAL